MSLQTLPIREPLTVRQGATLRRRYRWSLEGAAVDLSGWDARMQARRAPDTATLLADLTTGAGITLGADGHIDLVITAAQTAAMPAPTRGVYDLYLLAPGGDTVAFLAGPFVIDPRVTRDTP